MNNTIIIILLLFLGDHSVEVKLDGSHVEGSPFLVKAYNADKVKVTDINSGVVGKPVFFSSKLFIINNINEINSF